MDAGVLPCGLHDAVGPRRTWVFSRLREPTPTSAEARLGFLSFQLTSPCVAREDFWSWSQVDVPLAGPEVISSLAACGAAYATCQASIAAGWAAAPRQRYGTYSFSDAGEVVIAWAGDGGEDRWRVTDAGALDRAALLASALQLDRAYAWGSTQGIVAPRPLSAVATRTYSGTVVQNNYGTSITGPNSLSVSLFTPCDGGSARVARFLVECTYPSDAGCLNDAVLFEWDGGTSRRNAFNQQRDEVSGVREACIGPSGGRGHLYPLLQVLDDTGAFRGWVGIEASMYLPQFGSAIAGAFSLTDVP